jgi:hypothetical protein
LNKAKKMGTGPKGRRKRSPLVHIAPVIFWLPSLVSYLGTDFLNLPKQDLIIIGGIALFSHFPIEWLRRVL